MRNRLGKYQRRKSAEQWLKKNAACIGLVVLNVVLATWLFHSNANAVTTETYLSDEIQGYCEMVGEEMHICPELLEAIIEAESSGNPKAKNGPCVGLMQINEIIHAKRMQETGFTNLEDPYQNIYIGASYLLDLFRKYEDVQIVLAVYHGESDALRDDYQESLYVKQIIARSYQLEQVHGKIYKVKG